MKSNKILYLWQSTYPWEVRVEKITTSLIDHGYEVHLLCRHNNKSLQQNPQLIIHDFLFPRLASPFPCNPLWIIKLIYLVWVHKINLIICRDILVTPSALILKFLFKRPVLLDMAEHYPAALRGWKKYNSNLVWRYLIHTLKIADKVERFSVQYCEGIITVCKEQSQRLSQNLKKSDQICAVYNTPKEQFYKKIPLSKVETSKEPLLFAHHGYMTPERGLEKLIAAFALLKKEGFSYQLILAGQGELENELTEYAKKIQAPVIFLGKYKNTDFPQLISEIDIGVLAYETNEFIDHTVANKLFDYMSAGKPVLVSKTKALERIINETKCGAVIDITTANSLAESIIKFVNSRTGSEGANGRKAIIEKYNWEADQLRLIQFVESFLK